MYGESRRYGALSSSEDPQKLAATVTGLIKAAAGFLAFIGVSSVQGDVTTVADNIGQLITMGYVFYGLVETTFGIGRKIVIAIYARFIQ